MRWVVSTCRNVDSPSPKVTLGLLTIRKKNHGLQWSWRSAGNGTVTSDPKACSGIWMIDSKERQIAYILSHTHDRGISFSLRTRDVCPYPHCLYPANRSRIWATRSSRPYVSPDWAHTGLLPIARIGSELWFIVDRIINPPSFLNIARHPPDYDNRAHPTPHSRSSTLVQSSHVCFGWRTRNSMCRITSTGNTSQHHHHR